MATKGAALNVSGVKQAMFSLDDSINFVTWKPGSSKVLYFNDFGGRFHLQPDAKRLAVSITDNLALFEILFNASVGKGSYELPRLEQPYTGLFLRGDTRSIINQSSFTVTQLYIERGTNHALLSLCYRPSASITVTRTDGIKPVNSLRLYIISLNKSRSIQETGDFYLRVTCLDVTSTVITRDLAYAVSSITLVADFDGTIGSITLPVQANYNGVVLNVEVIVCNVRLETV
jgi:hypothetical protein